MATLPPLLLLSLLVGAPSAAPDVRPVDLEVRHTVVVRGPDGVTRTTEFRERVYRRPDLVWVERVVPPSARRHDEPIGRTREHRHADLSAASRWITRDADGLRLRLVLDDERLVLEVPPSDRASVAFDGDWETATRFIRASDLGRMTRLPVAAPPGSRWYEQRSADGTLRVLWDEAGQYPRRVESRNADGTVVRTAAMERLPPPSRAPWQGLEAYARKEYSDMLD